MRFRPQAGRQKQQYCPTKPQQGVQYKRTARQHVLGRGPIAAPFRTSARLKRQGDTLPATDAQGDNGLAHPVALHGMGQPRGQNGPLRQSGDLEMSMDMGKFLVAIRPRAGRIGAGLCLRLR